MKKRLLFAKRFNKTDKNNMDTRVRNFFPFETLRGEIIKMNLSDSFFFLNRPS